MARSAAGVSQRADLLASLAAVGRTRRMAASLACDVGSAKPRPTAGLGRDVPGRQLRIGEKGGAGVGKTKRGKGTKWMVLVDGQGIPLGAQLASASPAEVTLAESTLAQVKVPCWGRGRPRSKPRRVIADRAYDSNPLRERLHDLIAAYQNPERAATEGTHCLYDSSAWGRALSDSHQTSEGPLSAVEKGARLAREARDFLSGSRSRAASECNR
jgi:hypothetical protein